MTYATLSTGTSTERGGLAKPERLPSTAEPAVTVCFAVVVDALPLGAFTACDGLSCEMVVEQREEGGANGFVHQLPTRLKYSNVKLTRAVTPDTQAIADWFASLARGVSRSTATITAMAPGGVEVWRWHLTGVFPVRWTGPSLSLDSPKVATETLELAHNGFLAV